MKRKLYVLMAGVLLATPLWGQDSQDVAKRRRPTPRFDVTNPDVHDPVMAWEGDTCYIFSTGFGVSVMSSTDMQTWNPESPVFSRPPQWAMDMVPGYRGHTWAPDIRNVDGLWYLYYSCSTFGKNRSAIGLAVNKTLNPGSVEFGWHDRGLVIRSESRVNDWNAIDPNLVIDRQGKPWLTFGSFWDGVQLVPLKKDLQTPKKAPKTIARRRNPDAVAHRTVEANSNAVEAPFIFYHDGYYYLFVSFDLCCKGINSNYKTAVGRSKKIEGPYVDREGKKMLRGGGTVIAGESDEFAGVGHCAVYEHDGQCWFVAHGYSKTARGASKLFLRKLSFVDGWPVVATSDAFADYFQKK